MLPHYYAPLKIKTTKEGTRTLIEKPPAVIGEGTYGCVHRPSLRCGNKAKINYDGKISKLGKKKHINEEIAEYATIARVDKTNFFYPGKPNSCPPMRDEPTLEAINECRDFKSKDIAKYKLLVMKDGGENLDDYAKSIQSRRSDIPLVRQQMEKFWIEAHRMFLGITKFLDAGIVHHDLKHKNIVYNEAQNRINFIDFGLMTTVDTIKNESRDSNYGFSIRHWSFPPEMLFLNHDRYLQFADTAITIPKKSKGATTEKTQRQKEFSKFLNEIKDPDSHLNTFFAITDPEFAEKKQNAFALQQHTNEYYSMVMTSLQKSNYDDFLNKSVATIDSYGLASGFIYVLNKTRHLLNDSMANDLYNLFSNMLNFNVMERVGAIEALARYEDILQNHGILAKHNLSFENHQLKPNAATVTQVEKTLGKIRIPKIKVSDVRLESDPESKCPDGTHFNKKRKRCIGSSSQKRSKTSRRKSAVHKTKKIRVSKKGDL